MSGRDDTGEFISNVPIPSLRHISCIQVITKQQPSKYLDAQHNFTLLDP
jgi:hypothetical protein